MELRNTDSPRHEYYVHQALVDNLCHPLCDELREYWRVFDGETVGRLAQYLYQVGFSFPEPTAVVATAPTAPTSTVSDESNDALSRSDIQDVATDISEVIKEGTSEVSTPVRPLTPLRSLEFPRLRTAQEQLEVPPVQPTTPIGHNYEAVLLALAKLYILSYSQGIYALSGLCISRLHGKLEEISVPPIDTRILDNVVELLRYVYRSPRAATAPQPLQPAWEDLQNLASQFCALNVDVMEGNQEFKELLRQGGALATDMMAKTVRRLGSAEAALALAEKRAATAEAALEKADGGATTAKAVSAKVRKRAAVARAARERAERRAAMAEVTPAQSQYPASGGFAWPAASSGGNDLL